MNLLRSRAPSREISGADRWRRKWPLDQAALKSRARWCSRIDRVDLLRCRFLRQRLPWCGLGRGWFDWSEFHMIARWYDDVVEQCSGLLEGLQGYSSRIWRRVVASSRVVVAVDRNVHVRIAQELGWIHLAEGCRNGERCFFGNGRWVNEHKP